jgi:hypothetical protein
MVQQVSGDVVLFEQHVGEMSGSSDAAVRIAAAAASKHLLAEDRETVLLQLVDDVDQGVTKVAVRSAPAAMSDTLRSRVTAATRKAKAAKTAKGGEG